jgi:hypothetical protein
VRAPGISISIMGVKKALDGAGRRAAADRLALANAIEDAGTTR